MSDAQRQPRTPPSALPIEQILPAFERQLASHNFVVQAEPGAGKTTRLPLVLLEHGIARDGLIIVSQPRRLAARMAAARVATLLGEPLGETCGYQVRFESKQSSRTKLLFVTEGLLLRRLRDAPELPGVAAVVLDEFHERHLDGDVALALLRRLQCTRRPDLRLGVMSATLDADAIAHYLECPPLRSEGRSHPVDVRFMPVARDRDVASGVGEALRSVFEQDVEGSVLVFLPGAYEIRQTWQRCEGLVRAHGRALHALHGEMPAHEQDLAVRSEGPPKVILATNVAETSVTIPGITVVIDSGLVRRSVHRAWSGITELTVAKISQASATQRAGRAGRVAPGVCIRLYAEHDHLRRPAFDPPEIERADLSGLVLEVLASGARIDDVPWFEPPPAEAVAAAIELLRRLGALDERGNCLSDTGREMLRFPVHPRLARLLVEAQRRGIAELGATAAALLSERTIRRFRVAGGRSSSTSHVVHTADLLVDVDRLRAGRSRKWRDEDLDANACARVDRVRQQLAKLLHHDTRPSDDPDDALTVALLTAFPDRVARVRQLEGGARDLVLVGGGRAELVHDSAVADATFVVAVAAQEQVRGTNRRTTVTSAARVEPEWLLELFPEHVHEQTQARFNAQQERVEAVRELRYDDLVLESTKLTQPGPEAAAVLREAACARGLAAFADQDAIDTLVARSQFVVAHGGAGPALTHVDFEQMLARLCEDKVSFAQLRREDVLAWVLAELPAGARAELDRLAPTHVLLPNKRRVPVHYATDRPPWIESRLQDFFGTAQSPAVADGRVPLVLHLLAPNKRPVQVTTDLPSFWSQHYPQLRRALMRRYPKHDWPEDPIHAKPPPPGRLRSQ